RADEVFPDHRPLLADDGPSFTLHGMTREQYERLGDRVVLDDATGRPRAISREHVGGRLDDAGIAPRLDHAGTVRLADGREVEVATVFAMYRRHLDDYDLDTVCDITEAPRDLVEQLVDDLATLSPAAIH